MLLWLSHHIVVGPMSPNPSSRVSLLIQMASHAIFASPLYSDLHEDLDVTFCFLEHHEIGVFPIVKI